MPSPRISKYSNSAAFFATFTVKRWYYLFDRHNRWHVLADSLDYCIKNKGLKLYSFVFMLNHIHLLFQAHDCAGFVRDFKRHTSKELKRNLQKHEPSVLSLFVDQDDRYSFWQQTNMPIVVESRKFLLQKMNYIHHNPVRKQYVSLPEQWYWSSANPSCQLKTSPVD